jgi:nucleotide-binding universal stress UspA family protein
VDETPESVQALEVARRLFGEDAHYLAVNVAAHPVDWTTGYGYGWVWPAVMSPAGAIPAMAMPVAGSQGPGRLDDAVQAAEDQTLADARAAATDVAAEAGVRDVEALGETGDPVEAILRAAEKHDADVIVVGSHDRSWLKRLFEGSVATDLVRTADRPVLVVK